MTTSTTVPHRLPAKRWLFGAGLLVLAAGITVFALRPKPPPPEKSARAATTSERSQSYPIPSFERPEEAKRYFEAMIQG